MLTNEDKEKKIKEKKFLQRRSVICIIITVLIFCGFAKYFSIVLNVSASSWVIVINIFLPAFVFIPSGTSLG